MRRPEAAAVVSAETTAGLQRKCAACEEQEKDEPLKLARTGTGYASAFNGTTAPGIVHEVLGSPGHALEASTRAFFEPRFGHDFSRVRVHTGAQAADSAMAIGARAYTKGNDLVFGAGEYAPESSQGRMLLAHELAHVCQQEGSYAEQRLRRAPCRSSAPPGDPASAEKKVEKDAESRRAAQAAAQQGGKVQPSSSRLGENAAHFQNLLVSHGIAVLPEVNGFYVDPARPRDWLGTTKCKFFPGGSPGNPPAPAEKYCVIVPVEVEDEAKVLDSATNLTSDQRLQLASLLAIGSHEMQHAHFDESEAGIEEMAHSPHGPGQTAAECNVYTVIDSDSGATVADMLSEVSALTAEFPVYFRNIAKVENPEAALESHEQFNASKSSENLSGAIGKLQSKCPCQMVEDYVFVTVMFTMASWTPDERRAFLGIMTRMIPEYWPDKLKVLGPPKPAPAPAPTPATTP
jgi:hypothetical protein